MNWREVIENPHLHNLPFKIELNEEGQVVMSPTKVWHSICQGEISALLNRLMKSGKPLTECAIETSKGVKVADVAWASPTRLRRIRNEIACSIAPEICVEIVSESNSQREMSEKQQLYFAKGAKEVWFCDEYGAMSFYSALSKLKKSSLCPAFPVKIKL